MSTDTRRPLIVEFVAGIPAAGKSTIARACTALATSLGYQVHLNVKGLDGTQMASAFVRAPLFWRFLSHTLKSPPLMRKEGEPFLAHRWRCMVQARMAFVLLYEFTRRHPDSVVILDQWMSRKLDIVRDERRAADVFRFIAETDVYFNRHYVFMDLPAEVLADRAWRRACRRQSGQEVGWHRDYFLDKTALYRYYTMKRVRYERRYLLFKNHGMQVLKLDGERPAQENARLIIDRLVRPYVTCCRGRCA